MTPSLARSTALNAVWPGTFPVSIGKNIALPGAVALGGISPANAGRCGSIESRCNTPAGGERASTSTHNAIRMIRSPGALPWLVAAVWLLGTLFAFWFFELRLPQLPWCGGSGL